MHNMDMWMFNVMPMYMYMSGLQNGTHNAPASSSDMMVPKTMDMYMTMFMAMYMTQNWDVMAMTSYNTTLMTMDMNMMGRTESMTMRSQGFGDTQVIGGYNLINDNEQKLQVKGGVSLPTGRINYQGTMPMMDTTMYGYNMQMGSGTVDPILGLSYSYFLNKTTLNFNVKTTQRLYKNYRDYRLGSEYQAVASADYSLFPNFTIGPKLEGSIAAKTSGVAAGTFSSWGVSYNPNDTGGKLVNLFLEGKLNGSGALQYDTLAFQVGFPVYQSVNGTQMKQRWQASINLSFMFM